MELSELKQAWKAQTEQLDSELHLNRRLLEEATRNKIQQKLWHFRFHYWVEFMLEGLGTFWLTKYVIRYVSHTLDEWQFWLPGVLILIWMIGSLAWNVYQLVLADGISADRPITWLHKRLSLLQRNERLDSQSLLVGIPMLAWAAVVVIGKGVAGLDMYAILGEHMLWFIGGSFVVALLLVGFLRLFPDKGLAESRRWLKEINELRREES